MNIRSISKEKPVIAWWSGGATSAVTCKLCLDWFGKENVRVIYINTNNEDEDTYRFLRDCEAWYGVSIEQITNTRYDCIEDVWYESLSLNVAKGAKCSSELKIVTRQQFLKKNKFSFNAFGFDISENKRAISMKKNNSYLKPIFPLLLEAMSKKDCLSFIQEYNLYYELELPRAYTQFGLHNNNCLRTGCVQAGIGYWQKMEKEFPEKFDKMAVVEHELTNLKGEPVTMLKDQSKGGGLVFLKPHPKYPSMKDISMMKGHKIEPLPECSGFCAAKV